jgi:hypothetical protein
MFRPKNANIELGKVYLEQRLSGIPVADKLFTQGIADFENSTLCIRLQELFKGADTKNIKKIVAFGLGGLHFHETNDTLGVTRAHKQHAALLVIRKIIESKLDIKSKSGQRSQIPIFVQDPCHLENDVTILEKHDITVVKCTVGHMLGFTEIDDTTLVVDFACTFPTLSLIFEYTRPAALFNSWRLAEAVPLELPSKKEGETAFFEVTEGDRKYLLPNLNL